MLCLQIYINKMHNISMIEIYQLEYLLATVKEGSLLKASESLHVSQPALSRAIQRLEDDLGIPLFDRNKNRLILNENGKQIIDYASNILEIKKQLEEKAKDIKEERSLLRIALVAPGPTYRYPSLFVPTSKSKVVTSIENEEEIITKISNGLLDLGFINHNIEIAGITCQKLFDESLFLYLPKRHFLAGKTEGVYAKEADGQSFLLGENLGIWEDWTMRHLPNSKFYRQTPSDLADIVSASSIPAFVTNVTQVYRENTERIAIPILDQDATMPFYLIYKTSKKDKYNLNFLN